MPRAKKKAAAKKTSTPGAPQSKGDKKTRVLQLVAQHPDWGKKQIAKAAGCSVNHVYAVLQESGEVVAKPASPAAPSNGNVTAFYRAVKGVGGIAQAKQLLANIEAYENA